MVRKPSQSSSATAAPAANIHISQQAINETLRTIERRAKLYRNVLAAFAVLSGLALVSSIALRSGLPLLGFVLLVPLAGAFLILDGRHVRNWQAQIMAMWRSRHLDLAEFERMIALHRYVPPQSLAGMLAALPKDSSPTKLSRLSDEEKAALINKLRSLARGQERRTWVGTMALLSTLCLLITAIRFRSIALLLGLAGPLLVLLALKKRQQ